MYKKVIYRDKRDGEVKEEYFDVKGSRNKSGLTLDKRSENASIEFIKNEFVDYLGSFYGENKTK
jgi:hypothetical protein